MIFCIIGFADYMKATLMDYVISDFHTKIIKCHKTKWKRKKNKQTGHIHHWNEIKLNYYTFIMEAILWSSEIILL